MPEAVPLPGGLVWCRRLFCVGRCRPLLKASPPPGSRLPAAVLSSKDKDAIVTRMFKTVLSRGQMFGACLVRPAGLPQLGASPDAPRPRSEVVEVVRADGSHVFYDTQGRECSVEEDSDTEQLP